MLTARTVPFCRERIPDRAAALEVRFWSVDPCAAPTTRGIGTPRAARTSDPAETLVDLLFELIDHDGVSRPGFLQQLQRHDTTVRSYYADWTRRSSALGRFVGHLPERELVSDQIRFVFRSEERDAAGTARELSREFRLIHLRQDVAENGHLVSSERQSDRTELVTLAPTDRSRFAQTVS